MNYQLSNRPGSSQASASPAGSGVVASECPQQLIDQLLTEVSDLNRRNQALTNAVVNSADIIEELEQTRLQLAEARSYAIKAHENSQRMAETIFEGTHDAMIVMDHQFCLMSANRNARGMLGLDCGSSEIVVADQLVRKFHSLHREDWFNYLVQESENQPRRIELYHDVPNANAGRSGMRAGKDQSHPESSSDGQAKTQGEGEAKGKGQAGGHRQSQGQGQTETNEGVSEKPPAGTERRWIELSISKLAHDGNDALVPSEVRYLISAHDVTKRKRIEEQFQHQALHDNVTQLPNRRYFVLQAERLLAQHGRKTTFAVCFLDLDNFKTVNDTLGHEAGDQLLIQVAKRIKSTTRDDCFMARFGGDEFAILLPSLSDAEIQKIAARIVQALQQPFEINGNTVYIGASIGTTRYPEDGRDVNSLLQNADVAMYSAKEDGRNCFHPFTPELAASLRDRQSLLEDLRDTIENKQITLEYQPKWAIKTNRVAGGEALLRWQRNGHPVSPIDVIDVAECSGLILPLGQLIIDTAIKQMSAWREDICTCGHVAINVSPRQLSDPAFVRQFQRFTNAADIDPSIIELEITETAMMEDFSKTFERLTELSSYGVSIAIDDFGTGYSSLSYLKRLPVTTLKIDRSFIKDLPQDRKAIAIVKSILALGHGLGLKVVAEGVETCEQYRFLEDAGCDLVQGYLLSRSLPPDMFRTWALGMQNGPSFLE